MQGDGAVGDMDVRRGSACLLRAHEASPRETAAHDLVRLVRADGGRPIYPFPTMTGMQEMVSSGGVISS